MKTVREVEEDLDMNLKSQSGFYNFGEGGEISIIDTDSIESLLTEKTVIIKYKYGITVDNDKGGKFRYLPYFKFSRGTRGSKSKEIARIPILPNKTGKYEYQIHPEGIGTHFNLNSDDFDVLELLFRTETEIDNITVTGWKGILLVANSFITQYNDVLPIPLDLNIPDYRNLLEPKKGKK